MSSSCIIQNCTYNCCNYQGTCPASITGCYYYYPTPVILSIGTIIGIVIGCLVLLGFSIAFIVFLCRRCKYRKNRALMRAQTA